MTFKKGLIICFSLVFMLSGCTTLGKHKNDWPILQEPVSKPVKFNRVIGGYFITDQDATNLVDNIDALKICIEKQNLLINGIIKYYEK